MIYYSAGTLTVGRAFSYLAQDQPEWPFVEWRNSSISYAEFDRRISQFANALRSLGIQRGDHVLVRLKNCANHLVAMYGIHRAGCVYVGCSPLLSPEQVVFQLADADSVAAVVAPSEARMVTEAFRQVAGHGVVITADDSAGVPESSDMDAILGTGDATWTEGFESSESLATLIYTSGSTGRPKGVMWTHGQIYARGRRAQDAFAYTHADRTLHFFPLAHSNGGLSSLVPTILVGGTLVMEQKFSASRFSRQLVEGQITMVALNATHVKMVLAQPESELERRHKVTRAQFALNLDAGRRSEFTRRFGIRLVEIYGMTESGFVAVSPIWANHSHDAIGPPLPGIQMRIVDDSGADCSPGITGRILVKSDSSKGLFAGYYKDPAGSEAAYEDGWLQTGDLGSMTGDGFLKYQGRVFDTIKRSGFNVAPAEVERVLMDHPSVAVAVVVGIPDEMRESSIVAYIVLEAGCTSAADELQQFCAAGLAPHQVPEHFIFAESLPESELGKWNKIRLREMATEALLGDRDTSSEQVAGSL